MKKELTLIAAIGMLSAGSAQAASTHETTAHPTVWRVFQGLSERLSLERPYRQEDPPLTEHSNPYVQSQPVSFREEPNPVRFNIFHYLRGDDGKLQFAVYFK